MWIYNCSPMCVFHKVCACGCVCTNKNSRKSSIGGKEEEEEEEYSGQMGVFRCSVMRTDLNRSLHTSQCCIFTYTSVLTHNTPQSRGSANL